MEVLILIFADNSTIFLRNLKSTSTEILGSNVDHDHNEDHLAGQDQVWDSLSCVSAVTPLITEFPTTTITPFSRACGFLGFLGVISVPTLKANSCEGWYWLDPTISMEIPPLFGMQAVFPAYDLVSPPLHTCSAVFLLPSVSIHATLLYSETC